MYPRKIIFPRAVFFPTHNPTTTTTRTTTTTTMAAGQIALVSVFDKTGVVEFCASLQQLGYQIVSTGGTAAALKKGGVEVTTVSDITSFPEILGGRVKTLHPNIHGGILAKRTEDHLKELQSHNITPINIVVCNLYPFVETIAKEGITEDEAIEQIDIGGVTLLRAAAKNNKYVLSVSDPKDYSSLAEALKCSNGIPAKERKRLALKAFQHTAEYDTAISAWMEKGLKEEEEEMADNLILRAKKTQALRYGENPHQAGALYSWVGEEAPYRQVQGKELSYNNILDMESAWNAARDYEKPCVVIIKHNIPCGLAVSDDGIVAAYDAALASDPVSAFGSIIAVNREITKEFVERVGKLFVEVFISTSYSAEALEWLATKKKNCRVLIAQGPALAKPSLVIRSVIGGLLVQSPDVAGVDLKKWKVATKKQPTEEQMKTLAFAWIVCKHVKSNAIVMCQGTATVGVGAGQPNRIDAVGLAAAHAKEKSKGAILASDAFFPFADGIEKAAEHGVACVIQPGGSIRDDEVVKRADELGLVMVFTGERHFRH